MTRKQKVKVLLNYLGQLVLLVAEICVGFMSVISLVILPTGWSWLIMIVAIVCLWVLNRAWMALFNYKIK